ncbi:MAG: hypothetical protein ABTD50_24525, partial [Polyangiaceae bacterium]
MARALQLAVASVPVLIAIQAFILLVALIIYRNRQPNDLLPAAVTVRLRIVERLFSFFDSTTLALICVSVACQIMDILSLELSPDIAHVF